MIFINKLNIVLVEPEIPQNTGNIARTCAATGASLHLIEPLGFSLDEKHLKRAGLDYWHLLDLHIYKNIDEFFKENEGEFFYLSTKAPRRHVDVEYHGNVYLIFGKETKGLDEQLILDNIDRALRLPMITQARSLNLSNSVAIAAYEVLRQWNFENLQIQGKFTLTNN